jgi:hypothetical protein
MSSLASMNSASSTCLLKSAAAASASSNSAARCPLSAVLAVLRQRRHVRAASRTVRSVPPSLVGIGRVSFWERYAGARPEHRHPGRGKRISGVSGAPIGIDIAGIVIEQQFKGRAD